MTSAARFSDPYNLLTDDRSNQAAPAARLLDGYDLLGGANYVDARPTAERGMRELADLDLTALNDQKGLPVITIADTSAQSAPIAEFNSRTVQKLVDALETDRRENTAHTVGGNERLLQYVLEKTAQIDEIHLHVRDLENRINLLQELFVALQDTLYFFDGRQLQSCVDSLRLIARQYQERLVSELSG